MAFVARCVICSTPRERRCSSLSANSRRSLEVVCSRLTRVRSCTSSVTVSFLPGSHFGGAHCQLPQFFFIHVPERRCVCGAANCAACCPASRLFSKSSSQPRTAACLVRGCSQGLADLRKLSEIGANSPHPILTHIDAGTEQALILYSPRYADFGCKKRVLLGSFSPKSGLKVVVFVVFFVF